MNNYGDWDQQHINPVTTYVATFTLQDKDDDGTEQRIRQSDPLEDHYKFPESTIDWIKQLLAKTAKKKIKKEKRKFPQNRFACS